MATVATTKCDRCECPLGTGDDHTGPEGCIAALRRDREALYGAMEHLSRTTGVVVARVELCHPKNTSDLVFYITTGLKTRDDVLAALIASQLKSVHVFGQLLDERKKR